MENMFLTINETATLLRVTHGTVRKLVKNNKIYAVRIGGAIRIPRAQLMTMLEASGNRVSPS